MTSYRIAAIAAVSSANAALSHLLYPPPPNRGRRKPAPEAGTEAKRHGTEAKKQERQ